MTDGTLTGREIALTFDDGLRNHFAVVWPLLREYGVPATYFVCPDLIESDTWVWRAELRLRLKLLTVAERKQAAAAAGCGASAIDPIMEWTKSLPAAECQAFRDRVVTLTPRYAPSAAQIALNAPLTWDQLLALDPALITIGSHTRTHPLLTTLTDAQLRDEIIGSQRILAARLNRTVDLFCYPNGVITPNAVEMVRAHYRAGVSIRGDFVRPEDDPALLPRISADGSRATFLRRLHRPTA